jgi:predicted  nucleic acid-binding Zn-ribbon protein
MDARMILDARPPKNRFLFAATFCLCGCLASSLVAQTEGITDRLEGLPERIDAILEEDPQWMMGENLSDGLLLRRLSLDLRNVVPTQDEVDAFVSDTSEGRWDRWIDRFQKDPLASERLVDWYDKTLMQRRPFQHTDRNAWYAMLRTAVDENAKLDALVRSIITSVWWNRSQQAQQRFFLDRGGDPHAIARDLGRILFGRDMQCAQCHDHPQIDDYLQIDYHGLLAFVSASSMAEGTTKDDKGADQKVQLYVERASGDAPFESVFDKGVQFRTATRVPGQIEQIEPYLAPDQRYQPESKPDAFVGVGAPPVASRRELLALQLNGANRAFAENWANRLWALMFGRGIVHPLDMHHSDNPPSNPRLLATITDALIASQFDVPTLLAEFAKTRAYQRGHRLPIESYSDQHSVLTASPDQLNPWLETLKSRAASARTEHSSLVEYQSEKQASMDQARLAWRAAQQERTAIRGELDAAEAVFHEAQKKVAEAQKGLDQSIEAEKTHASKIVLLEEAVQKLEQARNTPEDAELAPAIAAAKSRADQIKGALPALQQAVAAATSQRDAATANRETERTKWQAIVDRIVPVEQRLLNADRVMVQAREEHDTARKNANLQLLRVVQTERFLRWLKLSSTVAEKRVERANLDHLIEPAIATLASHQSMVELAQKRLVTEQSQLAHFDIQVGAVASEVAAIESQLTQIQTARKGLSDVASLVADASVLESAVAELDRTNDDRMKKLSDLKTNREALAQQRATIVAVVQTANQEHEQARARRDEFDTQIRTMVAQREKVDSEIESLIQQCTDIRIAVSLDRQNQHAVSCERPLSPEQLALSILRSTHVLPNYVANEHAELNKQGELPSDATEKQRLERETRAVRGAIDKLRGNIDIFSNLYASGVGQTSDEFFASPDQALYFSNGGAVHAWAGPNGSNLSGRILQTSDPQQAAKEMFLGLLSREPSPIEQQFIGEQIANAGDQRPAVVQELVWSILAGAEYRMYP